MQAIRKALDGTGSAQPDQFDSVNRTPSDMAITAVTSLSNVKSGDLKLVAEAVAALYGVRSAREMSIAEFADNVCDALEAIPEENLRLPSSERAQFKKKLITLLSADLFTVVAKLGDLTIEHERTFCHARIVTDLRPVFGSEVEDGPKAMLVVHNLRLAYHEGSTKARDFYVSLDADDLRMLKQLIDRAEAKARSLKATTRDVPLLGVPEE